MGQHKIVRIITRLNIGGPAQQAVGLSRSMTALGWTTLLVAGQPDESEGDMGYLLTAQAVQVEPVPVLKRKVSPFQDLLAWWKIFRILMRERPLILHTHLAKAGAVGRSAGIVYRWITRLPLATIHTFHGHIFQGYFGRGATWGFSRIERALARFTDCLIAVSPSVKEDLVKFKIASSSQIRVVPLGLPLEPFLGLPPPFSGKPMTVGMIGRLVPIKNHELLFKAIRLLQKEVQRNPVQFVLVGDGELRISLERLGRDMGIADHLKFLGWQSKMEQVYPSLDIVCLTSKNEGTPVSLIEAMAAARPVIATDVGGVRNLLEAGSPGGAASMVPEGSFLRCERGILVRSGDEAGLAQALLFLFRHPEVGLQLGEAGRLFARERFSLVHLTQTLDRLYRELAFPYRKILLVRNDRMGDLLMSVPVAHAIREAFPQASISFLVRKELACLVEGHPDVDRVFAWDPGHGCGWIRILRWARRLRGERFDAVLVLNPTREFHLVSFLAGIPIRIGYRRKAGFLLNRSLPDTKSIRNLHEADYNLECAALLGLTPGAPVLNLPTLPETEAQARELLTTKGISPSERPVALHPWTSNPSKSWPLESFKELLVRLAQGNKPILVIGGSEAAAAMERWRFRMKGEVIDLVGHIPLGVLPAVLRRCAVLVSNDSGPVHVAAAVGTPTVVVAPGGHAQLLRRWKPIGNHHLLLTDPTVEQVAEAVAQQALSLRLA